MTAYKAPLDDLRFTLFDVLGAEKILGELKGGEAHSRDLIDAVLEEAGRLSEQLLAPTNWPGDQEGCHFDKATNTVTTPKGFKEAFKQFADGGWTGLTNPEAYGGQALPGVLGTATTEIFHMFAAFAAHTAAAAAVTAAAAQQPPASANNRASGQQQPAPSVPLSTPAGAPFPVSKPQQQPHHHQQQQHAASRGAPPAPAASGPPPSSAAPHAAHGSAATAGPAAPHLNASSRPTGPTPTPTRTPSAHEQQQPHRQQQQQQGQQHQGHRQQHHPQQAQQQAQQQQQQQPSPTQAHPASMWAQQPPANTSQPRQQQGHAPAAATSNNTAAAAPSQQQQQRQASLHDTLLPPAISLWAPAPAAVARPLA
ncbi:MAG: hypothetical protein WDW36_001137 [Sanguina aurantia]